MSVTQARSSRAVPTVLGKREQECRSLFGVLDASTNDQMRVRGAVGDISGRYFDIHGKRILGDLDNRIMALPWEDFRSLKNIVAVVCGLDKKNAILGARSAGT
jgi:DNA-binding transcriptional regulator LsrR (DeoR family)